MNRFTVKKDNVEQLEKSKSKPYWCYHTLPLKQHSLCSHHYTCSHSFKIFSRSVVPASWRSCHTSSGCMFLGHCHSTEWMWDWSDASLMGLHFEKESEHLKSLKYLHSIAYKLVVFCENIRKTGLSFQLWTVNRH